MSDTSVPAGSAALSRRELLASAGAGAAALLLDCGAVQAQAPAGRAVVFANTSVVTVDGDAGRRGAGGRRGRSRRSGRPIRSSRVSQGRGLRRPRQGALPWPDQLPRAPRRHHRSAASTKTSASPIGYSLPVQPAACCGRGGHADGRGRRARGDSHRHDDGGRERRQTSTGTAAALSKTGLRWVFAESIRDSENVTGRCRRRGLAKGEAPRFSPKLREEGLQRITDLFTRLARQAERPHQRVPRRRRSPRTRRPSCCRRSARSPRSTTSATRFTCRRAAPKSQFMEKFHGMQAGGVSRPGTASSARACSPRMPLRRRRRDRAARQVAARSFRTRPAWPPTAA